MTYEQNPAINISKLKELKKSPAHLKYALENPRADTTDMRFGRLFHLAVLEPERFSSSIAIVDSLDRRTKAGRKAYKEYIAAGKELITFDEMQQIEAMHNSLKQNSYINQLLKLINNEFELYHTDTLTGIDCKGRLDGFISAENAVKFGFERAIIIDLKTTKNAGIDEFSRAVWNFGHYNQAAWYCWLAKERYNLADMPLFIYIPIEKEPPYCCTWYLADNEMIEFGVNENRQLLDLYAKCKNSNVWEGYSQDLQVISLPPWAIKKFNNNNNVDFL
jgi:exodeoxyribonuclease VIII